MYTQKNLIKVGKEHEQTLLKRVEKKKYFSTVESVNDFNHCGQQWFGEKQFYTVDECKLVQPLWKTVWQFLKDVEATRHGGSCL